MFLEDFSVPGHILLVDDDEDDSFLTKEFLTEKGHTVTPVFDGPQALEFLKENQCDIILLDQKMPGMTGLEVLVSIRSWSSPLDLPIIMVTGMEEPERVVEALHNGANDYVTKPIEYPILSARIDTQLLLKFQREDLHRRKDFMESVLDSPFEMIISVDPERYITQFNRAAEKTFGYSRKEVLGESIDTLYATPEEGQRVHQKTLREDGFTGEILNRRKNGEEFVAHLSASVHRDLNGKPIGLVGISMDLTEQHKLEAEKARLLQQKEEFLALASHDLKSPLASVYSYAVLLSEKLPPGSKISDDDHIILATVKRNIMYMARIIDDFLDLHALEDGRIRLDLEPVDLGQLAQEVYEINLDYAKNKGIEISLDIQDNVPMASADKSRTTQVVQNLVGNAIKFCAKEERITVGVALSDGLPQFFVRDTGPGLKEEELEKVFGKYVRLSNRPTGDEKSTGLGLSICKRLIDLQNGEIGVFNNPDKGCTFFFSLPNHTNLREV